MGGQAGVLGRPNLWASVIALLVVSSGTACAFDTPSLGTADLEGVNQAPDTPSGRLRRATDGPRLVQWPREPVLYHEGSTLVLSCSLANAPAGPLKFSWFKQNRALNGAQAGALASQLAGRLSVETPADYSILRLADLRPSDSGLYACAVTNQMGQEDRTNSQVQVSVRLKWTGSGQRGAQLAPPGGELVVARASQPVAFECAAAGQPRPRIRWFRLVRGGTGGQDQAAAGDRPPARQLSEESQLRAAMLQLEAGSGNFQRASELGASLPSSQSASSSSSPTSSSSSSIVGLNGTKGNETSKWRVERISQGPLELVSRLILDRAEPGLAGLYECEASLFEQDQASEGIKQGLGGDRLRRTFGLAVNAPTIMDDSSSIVNNNNENETRQPENNEVPEIELIIKASTIDGRRKGACLFCQEYFMDLYLLAELKMISLKVTTVDTLKPPPDFRSNFDSTPPPILIDREHAILENEKIERYIMKSIPGGHNLFVSDKETASTIENLYSKFKLMLTRKDEPSMKALLNQLQSIDQHLERRGSRFLTGDTMCCFDCELMPRLQHIKVAGKYFADFDIPVKFEAIWRYMYNMYQLDAFTQSCPADQDIINHYKNQQGAKTKKHEELEMPTFSTSVPANLCL